MTDRYTANEVRALIAPVVGLDMEDIANYAILVLKNDGQVLRSIPEGTVDNYVDMLIHAMKNEYALSRATSAALLMRVAELERRLGDA